MEKVPLTREGYKNLKEELERLKRVERPANIRAIEEAMAESPDVVVVHQVGLAVAPLTQRELLLEPPPLIDGIVDLRIAVGHLEPPQEQLEAVGEARVVGTGLRQW